MKVYFVGSIAGKTKYKENYEHIISILEEMGNKVVENTMGPTLDQVYSLTDEGKIEQYRSVLKWIQSSDILVAEATHPSLGVGYEISLALEKGKPVVVLYSEGNAPHFLEGYENEKLVILKYRPEDLKDTLTDAVKFASEQADIRFNFFISPSIATFLDWISKEKRIPRSVYLRRLIENDIKNYPEYQAAE